MKTQKTNYKKRFVLISLILMIAMITSALYYYNFRIRDDLELKNNVFSLNLKGVYDEVSVNKLDLQNRLYLGSNNASLTFAAFIDFSKESSKYYIDNIYPMLKKDYIDTGKVRYYHFNQVSFDAKTKKTDNFVYSVILACVADLMPDKYFDYYLDLFQSKSIGEALLSAQKYGFTNQELKSCLSKDQEVIIKDIDFNKKTPNPGINPKFYIGIEGTDNIIINGIPSYEYLKEQIRKNQISIGE